MASQKMLRRITKAYDWIDGALRFAESRRHRFSGSTRETLEVLEEKIARLMDERYQLQVFYTDAVSGKTDDELLAAGLAELEGYRNWRRGSAKRVVPTLRNCPRCDGSGRVPVADPCGEYDGDEPCSCPQGKRVEARMKMPSAGTIIRLYEQPF